MGRKPKLYVPLVVGFLDDERIAVAGDGSTILYLAMCLKAKMLGSDGRLSQVQISRLNRPKWKRELATLVDLGLVLFDDAAGDWFISAWFSHNDAISQVESRRAVDRERKRELSGRNPNGFHSDSGLKKEEGREGKGREARGTHAFVDDGQGCCEICGTLPTNSVQHLRAV